MLSDRFVSATEEKNTFARPVPAPYIRKTFSSAEGKGKLTVTCTGFYRAFFNGIEITKGILAPYMTNPDQILFYDTYELDLLDGKNAIAFILGNGTANSLDYDIWEFESASFRSSPKVAFAVEGNGLLVEADGSVWRPSPVRFDDLRAGEFFDKREEIPDFSSASFDDSSWAKTIAVPSPKGEKTLSTVPPVVTERELKAVKITPCGAGYIYDFGYNTAGNMRLRLQNSDFGQELIYVHTEILKDGKPDLNNIVCGKMFTNQTFRYTAAGLPVEVYRPYFSYVGCRYVYVEGIRPEQAAEDLFTFEVMHGGYRETGFFRCSSDMANRIEAACKNSDKSNLFYFPTDCPHREKNGWTGDAAVSAEHFLANLDVAENFKTWLRLIVKSQREDGALPGIVPTGGWGFRWGNGPIWDRALIFLPYETYRVNGDKEILMNCQEAVYRYLRYTEEKLNGEGLADFGLGDWLQPHCTPSGHYIPTKIASTLSLVDSAKKSALIFAEIGENERAEYASAYAQQLIDTLRKHIKKGMKMQGNCQTAQAMAIDAGVFTEPELPQAKKALLDMIHRDGDTLNTGFPGTRVLFHVLHRLGETELAYKMIVQTKYPSYGYMMVNGPGSMWEAFEQVKILPNGDTEGVPDRQSPKQAPSVKFFFKNLRDAVYLAADRRLHKKHRISSLNHHAFNDVSNFFKRAIVGICLNDGFCDIHRVDIRPYFIEGMTYAEASRETADGTVKVRWDKMEQATLQVRVPSGMHGKIVAPTGYVFTDGKTEKELISDTYTLTKR